MKASWMCQYSMAPFQMKGIIVSYPPWLGNALAVMSWRKVHWKTVMHAETACCRRYCGAYKRQGMNGDLGNHKVTQDHPRLFGGLILIDQCSRPTTQGLFPGLNRFWH
jgi:hypothetical protein